MSNILSSKTLFRIALGCGVISSGMVVYAMTMMKNPYYENTAFFQDAVTILENNKEACMLLGKFNEYLIGGGLILVIIVNFVFGT